MVAEFTFNEPGDQPFTSPQRRGFEQLLRKLARLPGAPAVVVLHHYAWCADCPVCCRSSCAATAFGMPSWL